MTELANGMYDLAKRLVFAAYGNPLRLARRLRDLADAKAVTILNLHRVAPDDGSSYRPLDPLLFEELLIYLKANFEVATIAQAREPTGRPRVVLSFDDGYLDFYEYALPLLEKHGVRVNHNFIPECILSGFPPLNVAAQDFVGKARRELVERLDVPGFSQPRDASFGHKLSTFLKNMPQARRDELAPYLIPQFERDEQFRPTRMMTLDQVREVAKSHEMGAHSYRHSSMEFESDAYLRQDVRDCREFFATEFGQQVRIYAFPNGSCREGQAELVLEEGIEHVLLVGESFDRGECIHQRFTFDARSRPELVFKATGRRQQVPR